MTSHSHIDLGASLSSLGAATNAQAQNALKIKSKSKAAAENFESMFIGNMFQNMFTGVEGDGPFGGKGAEKVWRSFAIDQFAKNFAKAGGIGLAPKVYQQLLQLQGLKDS
ncbi:MAG TPA: rod-binding protein [Xanthobacteraceae bacterium]|jgi:Rod binding domain-containing protein|nr:rod-binding protein [Xanthobacteraceae bacterium]